MASYMFYANVGRLHTLLSVLADERCPCYDGVMRSIPRLFLDIRSFNYVPVCNIAYRLKLVNMKFINAYLIGGGENFIGLTGRGKRMVLR